MIFRFPCLSIFWILLASDYSWGTGIDTAKRVDTLTIVAFGNSTTAIRPGVREGYAVRLEKLLRKVGVPCKVVNNGIGGSHTGKVADNGLFKIRHGMDRFPDVLAQQADWVIIWFGINDAWIDDVKTMRSRISLNDYVANLSHFIREIRQQGGKVILMTPNALGAKYEPWRMERLEQYTTATRRVADALDVKLLDVWQLGRDDASRNGLTMDDYLLDGMHPNDQFHQLIADYLVQMINPSNKKICD